MTDRGAPDPASLRDEVRAFARPRLAGTDAAVETRRRLADRLTDLGYRVRSLDFEYSAWPGLYGLTALGLTVVAASVVTVACLSAGRAGGALVVLGGLAVGVAAALSRLPAAIAGLPFARRAGVNLLGVRGHDRPLLLVAHLDSKSQGLSTLGRTAAGAAVLLGWLGLVITASAAWRAGSTVPDTTPPDPVPGGAALAAALILAGGLALTAARTGNRSPGALDNATGLVGLLSLAEALRDAPVAVLVTDAEELGLAGARAAVDRVGDVAAVVNLDGLDDRGPMRIAYGRAPLRRRDRPTIVDALCRAARREGVAVSTGPVPPGLLTDHMPFARAGVPAVTVMRGSLRSLLRVHTPSDTADRLDCTGLAEAVRVIRRGARRMKRGG